MSFWDICGDLSNVIATGLAALSIYLTVVERKNAREHEKNRNIMEQKLLWYNEVVLNDIIKSLNEFVDEARRQLDNVKGQEDESATEKDLKEIYSKISDQFKSVREKLYLLKTFSMTLYKECDDKLQIIFDLYSNAMNEAIQKKRKPYINPYEIQRNKGDIFSDLYKWANDFVKTGEKN